VLQIILGIFERKGHRLCTLSSIGLTNRCVLQPAVSIGNVGQLAIDLLIANLPLELVGHIYDKDILPVSGNDAYGVQGRIITSADGMELDHIK
jgi:predicted ATP-grasp superfamily ATP-dependent carboligase